MSTLPFSPAARFVVRVGASLVTPESAARGDVAETWIEDEDRDADLDDVLRLAERSGVSARYPGDLTAWWTAEPEMDYRSGDEITRTLHVSRGDGRRLTAAEFDAINQMIADGCRVPEEA